MIDVLIAPAHAHGGCYECDANDDRGDDIRVFRLGPYVIRLCRVHATQLVDGLSRAAKSETR